MTYTTDYVDPEHHLPWNRETLWMCPECCFVNAWNHEDAERAGERLGEAVVVSHGSAFDNICGNCGANIVHPESPTLHPAYTHELDR